MARLLIALCAVFGWVPLGYAQTAAWPSKPVRIIVPFAAGALTDTAARGLARELSATLGQQFLVENRGGAGGTIGTDLVAKAPADGHTLVFTDSSYMITAALYPKLPYKPLTDLVPIGLVVEAPAVLVVRNGLPAKNLRELVALAKKSPGSLTFGSGGQGASAHLSTELFSIQAGIEMKHIPYKGVGPALSDVMADRIDMAMPSFGGAIGPVKSGFSRAFAITGNERSAQLPDTPTFADSGFPNFDVSFKFGFLTPAGTPEPLVTRMFQEIVAASLKPAMREFLGSQGSKAIALNGAQYTQIIEKEIRLWKDVIDKAKVKVE
jgi:tripartite-type tricarboxylate transporter receptor subunit TctC